MTRPSQTAAITKDSRARKSVTTSHTLSSSPFSIKEAWILTWVRWFFGKLVWHSLHLLAFWIESLFFPPILLSNLSACHVASSTRLDSITRPHGFSVSTAHDPPVVYGHPRCITRKFYWYLNSDWPSSATVLSLGVKEKKVKSLSHVRFFATPWTAAYQAPPSMRFSRQEYWSGLPFPSPGDLPNPGIESRSPTLQADALTSEPPGKP